MQTVLWYKDLHLSYMPEPKAAFRSRSSTLKGRVEWWNRS